MIALLVMTDGRDHVFDTIRNAEQYLEGPISERWIHDDSADPRRVEDLRLRFPAYRVISTAGRSGFGGAIRSAWQALRIASDAPYVFHLEDDFRFRWTIDLDQLVAVLDQHPALVNLALRRQPVNAAEVAAGGVVELHPEDFIERHDFTRDLIWLEHRRFFTTNPSLYRRSLLLEHDWPDGPDSEGRFTHELLAEAAVRFGYFGARASGEWCQHVGHDRAGTGY